LLDVAPEAGAVGVVVVVVVGALPALAVNDRDIGNIKMTETPTNSFEVVCRINFSLLEGQFQ
jgi:hypothetical protein